MKKYPFKHLKAYTLEDEGFFFGRKSEVNELYRLIHQSQIVLVYGASGTGKTSLIQCGLASKFDTYDWLPIFIRRGMNINASLDKELCLAGRRANPLLDVDLCPADYRVGELEGKIEDIYRYNLCPIYLIFDQFEELYVIGDSPLERKNFIDTVKEILNLDNHSVKMIFAMREEFLGYLNKFEKEVPFLTTKKIRVEPMGQEKVKEVILGATSHKSSNITLKKGEEDALAVGIFEKIKEEPDTLFIKLPYLQVFLDKYYFSLSGDDRRKEEVEFSLKSLKKMGDIGDVLRDFLEEQVYKIYKTLKASYQDFGPELIWQILGPFASLEGTKKPTSLKALYDQFNQFDQSLIDKVINALVESRILNYSEKENLYEIAHDSLAHHIAERRTEDQIEKIQIKRLIKSQTAVRSEDQEEFSPKRLGRILPVYEELYKERQIDKTDVALIKRSEKTMLEEIEKKERERKRKMDEMRRRYEEENQLRTEADEARGEAFRSRGIARIGALVATVVAAIAFVFFLKEQNALKTNRKQQTISTAKEIMNYGRSFEDLNMIRFACSSYKDALDKMKGYEEDPLYIKISQEIRKSCDN